MINVIITKLTCVQFRFLCAFVTSEEMDREKEQDGQDHLPVYLKGLNKLQDPITCVLDISFSFCNSVMVIWDWNDSTIKYGTLHSHPQQTMTRALVWRWLAWREKTWRGHGWATWHGRLFCCDVTFPSLSFYYYAVSFFILLSLFILIPITCVCLWW